VADDPKSPVGSESEIYFLLVRPESQHLVNAETAEVDFDAGNFCGFPT
jgi:hypothetical protein